MSSGLHRDANFSTTDKTLDDLHILGYIVDTVADLSSITTASEGRAAMVRSPLSLWLYGNDSFWHPSASGSGFVSPVFVVDNGVAIGVGSYALNVPTDSSHPIVLDAGEQAVIYQTQNHTATITPPDGCCWNDSSTGPKVMGFGDVMRVTYLGVNHVYFVEYQATGAQ